jgi:hypothetical protein
MRRPLLALVLTASAACTTDPTAPEIARSESAVGTSPWHLIPISPPQLEAHSTIAVTETRLLIGGGLTALDVASDRGFVLAYDPAKHAVETKPAGKMVEARFAHTATLLGSGKILVAGGESIEIRSSAELADPMTGTSMLTAPMKERRSRHAAALLASGKVLVVGGGASGVIGDVSSSELLDPATNTWSDGPVMSGGHAFATATTLTDGRVVVVGGLRPNTDVYDPATNTFARAGNLLETRVGHVAVLLPSGKVLVAGGYVKPPPSAEVTRSAEVFDPATKMWTRLPDMPTPRGNATATRLQNGLIMVAGGRVELTPLNYVDFYDEKTNTWSSGSPMVLPHALHTANAMPNGDVIVMGSASGEIFTPIATGSACAQSADCASGFCVDGVCCQTACTGSCERCDTSGARGTCTAVSGAFNHCAPGNTCIQNECVPSAGTTCSADKLGVVDKDGKTTSCAPFICDNSVGACVKQCTTSVECAPGNLCDATSKQCTATPSSGGDDGGCAYSPATSHVTLLVFVGIALLLARRRQRAA